MKTKHVLALVFALVALGATLIWGTEPVVLALSNPVEETEFGKFYTEFDTSWMYIPDGENIWSVSPSYRGDCEDFALTFYSEYPHKISAWILVVRTRSSLLEQILGAPKYQSHALLVLWETRGFYVVDNGNTVHLVGPFVSYEETTTFYMEASGAESAWDWYLPLLEDLPSSEDIRSVYVSERSQILP